MRLARELADTLPDPLDSVLFLNSGREAIDGAIKLARRVTGRPAIIAFRGAFHGRTFGATSVTSSNLNYRRGYEPLLPGVYLSPYPSVYRDFGGDEERAVDRQPPPPARPARTRPSRPRGRRHHHRARPGRGRLLPGPAGLPPGPAPRLRPARDPARSPTRSSRASGAPARCGRSSTPGIVPDVVCMAKAIANGLPLSAIVSRQGRSRSAGARAPTARRTAATPWPARPASPSSRRSASEDLVANAARCAARSWRAACASSMAGAPAHRRRPRAGPDDRRGVRQGPRDARARRGDGEAVTARAAEAGCSCSSCGVAAQRDPLDPAAGRHRAPRSRRRCGSSRARSRAEIAARGRPGAAPAAATRPGGSSSRTNG